MSSEIIRLQFDDEGDFGRWQTYVHERPDSQYSDLAEWRPLFRELYGFDDHSYAFVEDGRITGALSLYHIRSPLMGRMLVTNPFYGSGGFYWDNDVARDALAERALAVARELAVHYVEFRLRGELPAPFESNTDFAEYDLKFGASSEETWTRRLSSNTRQNIRKSLKQNLEFRLSDDHRRCYGLLCHTLRAHGTPFHGERFFRLLRKHLGERVRFSEVWRGKQLIAGGIVVRYKDTISTPYIGSLANYRPLRPNYLQYWKLIEHYAGLGVRCFEMGRSPRDSTHARFKKKWGCEEFPVQYSYVVIDERKGYRTVSRPSAFQRLATNVWRRLPLAVTTVIGPRLFRYIP